MNKILKLFIASISLILVTCGAISQYLPLGKANAMPFYSLNPKDIVLRSEFYTSYTNSSPERKHNIALASNALNNTFIDVNAEFSFNLTVGARTEKRGYKKAKIISSGKYIDGVGGGVCQVSTTLYNAILLSGLEIAEFHPHSLPVSYIAPSFDAMVNSNTADFRFINNTSNPIIIKSTATDSTLNIKIYGEPLKERYLRESNVICELDAEPEEVVLDDKNEYPTLFEGEFLFLSYSKKGLCSEGYILKQIDGKTVSRTKIRQDKYKSTRGTVIQGTAKRPDIIDIPIAQ